ncbi:LysR substrate-binding domain-containing protein [Kiloniella sp.]|uniref:LysR substrate-binding domain-containing protein n=1 Tax=Kiloniella sp. TaxID=1938587 RepID=UPI003B01E2B3
MRLNHRQLEAFRAMIETGSVTDAAKRILITQPAASRLLSDLEHTVGYPLFRREKKRLSPTPEALALFEEVERSFIGIDMITEAAREIGSYRRGALHIAGMPAMSLGFLPRVIAEFCVQRPEISIALQIHSSQKVIQCIASQQFDLGFAESDTTHPGVTTELLYEAPMIAVLPKKHRLCSKPILEPKDFEDEIFVALGANYPTRKRVDAMFLSADVQPKMRIETQLSFAVGQIVSQGGGVSLIDPITAIEMGKQSLVETRPFAPSLLYQYNVLFPSLRPKSRISNVFLELVRSHLAQDKE